MEGSDDSGRADQNEGTTLWLQPGSVNIVLNDMDLSNDLAGPLQIQMDWLNYLHLFCMHAAHTGALDVDALSNENIEVLRQELLVPVDCSKLAGCGRKVRRSAAVYGASTVSAAFGM